jgi:aspartyl-tRNA(Asn)/glutamyl-tRNA(Gln) amidotransferase subunit A
LDVVGVLARKVEDIALVFTEIAGHDPWDATTVNRPVPKLTFDQEIPDRCLGGLRIGVPDEYFIAGIQQEVSRSVQLAIQHLEDMGAQIVRVQLPHTSFALPVYYIIAPAEASANLARYDGIRYGPRAPAENMWDIFFKTRGSKFGAEVKRRIMLGTYALSAGYYDAYYGQAQKVRTLIRRDFEQAFSQVDLLAAPVCPNTAFRIGEHSNDPLSMYLEDIFTMPANLAGIPALAFPVGFDSEGLPIGMQLMGPAFEEERLFRVAHVYQKTTNWHLFKPQ